MEALIRNMISEDWSQVSIIYKQGIEIGNVTFQQACPTYEKWDEAHLKECRYVALVENEVVGFIAVSATSKREAYKGVVEVSIYVRNDEKGKGIGTKLLQHLCTESEKIGIWSLFSVAIEGNDASLALHKKCGFREIGYKEKVARDKFGKWRNTILLERRSKII